MGARQGHLLGGRPLEVVHSAVEADLVGDLRARNLPGVAVGQPDVRQLLLVPLVIDGLLHPTKTFLDNLFSC